MDRIPVGYTFIKRDSNGTITIKRIPDEHAYLPDLIEDITEFLEGCGFHLNGHLDIFEEE